MKLSSLVLIDCLLFDSVAVADWPLHQSFPSVRSQAQSFFDSKGRYIEQHMIYPPAIELHQANGTSRALPYPTQRLPDSHGHAQRHSGELHTASPESRPRVPPPFRSRERLPQQ
jgi:hypothetical protein